jgi:hypothetical protein
MPESEVLETTIWRQAHLEPNKRGVIADDRPISCADNWPMAAAVPPLPNHPSTSRTKSFPNSQINHMNSFGGRTVVHVSNVVSGRSKTFSKRVARWCEPLDSAFQMLAHAFPKRRSSWKLWKKPIRRITLRGGHMVDHLESCLTLDKRTAHLSRCANCSFLDFISSKLTRTSCPKSLVSMQS